MKTTRKRANYKTLTRQDTELLLMRALEITTQINEVKPLYRELDAIVERLLEGDMEGSDWGVELIDNFSTKNTMFKNVAFNRYCLNFIQPSYTAMVFEKKHKKVGKKKKKVAKKKKMPQDKWEFPVRKSK